MNVLFFLGSIALIVVISIRFGFRQARAALRSVRGTPADDKDWWKE